MVVVLLGATEAARVLATAASVPGGEFEVARRVLAGWTLDTGWRPPPPPSLTCLELLERLRTLGDPTCLT